MLLTEKLRIEYPIIQAPMAGSDNAEFVAAACNAGVLGSLGAQYRTPQEITKAIERIKTLTDKPFAINLFALPQSDAPSAALIETTIASLDRYYKQFGITPPTVDSVQNGIDAEEQLQAVLEARVPVFSFTLGILSAKWIDAFKSVGTFLIGTATNLKEAQALQESGVDAITAQGAEAGGHRGTFIGSHKNSMIGLFSLIPQMVDTVQLPVIAAGGIMDGRGIAAAFVLGAQAAQMGTAFLTVDECPVNAAYKEILRNSQPDDTEITQVFSGGAARGIRNKYMAENQDKELLPFPYQNSLTKPFRKIANQTGQIQYTNLWSGQSSRMGREVATSELIARLTDEINIAISNCAQLKMSTATKE